ncbi:glycoside/pentoside/hexuronide:cation symporter, GPH family [Pseudobutyrivibrio sp. YE44]|uniref:MFS transporter n=1 Tax=Pseudobutyrivibrio sp. YE44 TaxID=1520802 RepID=UPI000884D096|nr:MFS transporter [Pseudobutyrivibrio sp. YE44]SDB47829.1 glycoside/pentoside/hexuronide:cation symporter, GPH family [Pseudobutyrivibrio sp. YE44]
MKQLKPITNKLLWIFALGQFGWSLLSGVVSNWMVYYYTGTPSEQNPNTGIFAAGITQNPIFFKLTLFGLVLAVGRIFDAVTDPLIAGWSDRSNYKGGRRIPFMRVMAIPFALCTIGLFTIPQTSNQGLNDTALFILLMVFYLFMTMFCTPYNALIAELGDTQRHRINVSTYISLTFIVGQSISFLLPNLAGALTGSFGQAGGIRMAVAIMATIACLAMLFPAFYINERDYIDSKPSDTKPFKSLVKTFSNGQFRRFVASDVIYFFALTLFQTGLAFYETQLMEIEDTYTFLLTATMTFISVCLYPVVNILAKKIGKKQLIIIGFFAYSVVFLITTMCGVGLHWGFIVAVTAAIPMAILGILPQACVADVAELTRLETGEDRSGMFFAARTFAFKMGQAIAMVVFTSVTVSGTKQSYRTTALIAFITCFIGACIFFTFNEKKILSTIRELKGSDEI